MTQKDIEKANCFLKQKYNIFHADIISVQQAKQALGL